MLRRLCAFFAWQLVAESAVSILQSALVAICLATAFLQLASLLGTSLPVWLALCAAIVLGAAAGLARRSTRHSLRLPGMTDQALLHFVLAVWMVGSPWAVQLVDWAIAQPGVISLTSPLWNAVTLTVVLALALGVPAYLATRLLLGIPVASSLARPMQRPLVFLGAAVGLSAWGMGLAQILGPWLCGIFAAGIALIVAIVRNHRQSESETNSAELASPRIYDRSQPSRANLLDAFRSMTRYGLSAAIAAGCGGWLAAFGRLLEQLMPGSVDLACFEAIGVSLGIAAGLWVAARRQGALVSTNRGRGWALCCVAVWGVSLVAAFPLLVQTALWLNAFVATPWLLLISRGLIAAAAVLPVGIATAFCVGVGLGENARPAALRLGGWLAAALLGYGFLSAWGLSQFSTEVILIGLAWWTIALAAAAALAARRELSTSRWRRLLAAGAVALVAVAPMWRGNFDARQSAKLLFNAHAALAYRNGLDASLLTTLDDARPMATVTGERGIYTVWRSGGHQLQIRENGVPRGVASTDSEASPRFVPETLQTALPLVLHDRPRRMLVIGLGSGESLTAAVLFPIPEIVCVEADAGLVELLRNVVADGTGAVPLEDDRVTLSICDPSLGLAATRGKFDVILSSPEHLALARSQPYLTAEFYRRAARKLTPEGIFCQRLQFVDFGPRVLQTIVGTVQSVFRDMLILEVAPGEYLLAATNDSRGLVRPGLAARFEFPHVRALLAQSGIDWTVVLNLDGANRDGLNKFCAVSHGELNQAATGRLPFSMPREVMRWASKPREIHEALNSRRGRLLAWIGEDAESPVLVRRLAEVQGQFDLMTKYADQYWAYRASLRDQVKEKSRSQIQQASATDENRQLHAEDQRRLRYFEVLGQAVRSARAADIERLARFASPYDPLISYFVHEEAAELYARSEERDVASELRHRLYATFFSSPKDASLRNVIAALALLREHPDAEPDPVARWDDLNALLQALKLRWDARAGVRPTNINQVIHDLDATILAVEQTIHELDKLTAEAGLPAEFWENRRIVLEKTLIRPVKTYQLELLPHLHRRQAQALEDGQARGAEEQSAEERDESR